MAYFDVTDRKRNNDIRHKLERRLDEIENNENLIMVGDFNGPQKSNWNGQLTLELMDKANVILLNGDEKCSREITRNHPMEKKCNRFHICQPKDLHKLY